MKKMTALIVALLLTLGACSFALNRAEPRYTEAGVLEPGSCRQSNLGAGLDFVGALAGLGLAGDSVLVALVTAVTYAASAAYGMQRSRECRLAHAEAEQEVSGATDWVYPPAIAFTLGVMIMARPRGGSGAAVGICEPGEIPTGICNDDTPTCAANRSGACSWHGGVREMY